MKKLAFIILLVFTFLSFGLIESKAALGLPTSQITSWSSVNLYASYYQMQSNLATMYAGQEDVIIYIPPTDYNTNSIGGVPSEIIFYDNTITLISKRALTPQFQGWIKFDNTIVPSGAVYYKVFISQTYTSTPSGYVNHYNTYSYGYAIVDYLLLLDTYQQGYNDGVSVGSNQGYINGYSDGENQGYINGYSDGEQFGYIDGYDIGVIDGYNQGIAQRDNPELDFDDVLDWIFKPFDLFQKEIAFGITIGHFAIIPLVFGLVAFLFSLKKGKR